MLFSFAQADNYFFGLDYERFAATHYIHSPKCWAVRLRNLLKKGRSKADAAAKGNKDDALFHRTYGPRVGAFYEMCIICSEWARLATFRGCAELHALCQNCIAYVSNECCFKDGVQEGVVTLLPPLDEGGF